MIIRCLLLCATFCSAFSSDNWEDHDNKKIITAVRNIIFRKFSKSDLLEEKVAFVRGYLTEVALEDSENYERGYAKSTTDPFFVQALEEVAKLVDGNPGYTVRVADFGCGNGTTSFLFALTGAKVLGIENYMTKSEYSESNKIYKSYTDLAKKLGLKDLDVEMMVSTDATVMPGYPEYAPDNSFDLIFMGNFLHMFDPATSKNLIRQHAHRMLKTGCAVFASADGIALAPEMREIYISAKQKGAEFPTAIKITSYGLKIDREIVPTELRETFSQASIDGEGYTLDGAGNRVDLCRRMIEQQLFLDELPLELYAMHKTVCFYNSRLINRLFPASDWGLFMIPVTGKDIIPKQRGESIDDIGVLQWNIVSIKEP